MCKLHVDKVPQHLYLNCLKDISICEKLLKNVKHFQCFIKSGRYKNSTINQLICHIALRKITSLLPLVKIIQIFSNQNYLDYSSMI